MATKKQKLYITEGERVTFMFPGQLYYFKYEAEPSVPYYDRFPLVFLLRKKGRLLEGFNFHYMRILNRLVLLERMQPFFEDEDIIDYNEEELGEDSRLRVRAFRQLVYTSKRFRFARATIHRYKMHNIRSKILRILPEDWKAVATEFRISSRQFVTSQGGMKTISSVFQETKLKAREGNRHG